MPDGEAISTTKRKFYKALDALSNPPAAKTPFEPAAKRVRRSISSNTSTLSRRPIVVPATARKSQKPTIEETPNFSPWSHETFLARLKTFSSVSLWHPKPEAVSEVAWAKRGWTCVDVNTVGCRGGCERRVVIILDSGRSKERLAGQDGGKQDDDDGDDNEAEDDHASLENALVQRYSSLITEGHSESCLWRQAGCKDDIYRLQVVRPAIWQPDLQERSSSLFKIHPSIRNVKVRASPSTTPNHASLEPLLTYLPQPSTLDPADSAKVLNIALHGWYGATQISNDLLLCQACFQRIGLWMYQPGYKPSYPSIQPDTTVDDDDEEEEEAEESMTIDLLEQHRDHCPWRNATSQKASGSLAGLNATQILQRVTTTWAREQRRKTDDQHLSHDAASQGETEDTSVPSPALSRVEIAAQDQERESRLRKLKNLFTIKRRSTALRKVG
nr:mrna export factor rsm1 [Quercus suber]